jgi:hypothetical protein
VSNANSLLSPPSLDKEMFLTPDINFTQ